MRGRRTRIESPAKVTMKIDFSRLPRPQAVAADGVVVVDKPPGVTSHDVVAMIRRLAGTRKVGHAGTLDPDATGVLVVGVGKATRLLQFFTSETKEYAATVRFGVTTVTEDASGKITGKFDLPPDLAERLKAATKRWTGKVWQVPSAVSAIKMEGKKAYELVRQGEKVELPARQIEISGLQVGPVTCETWEGVPTALVPLKVTCSKGTFIRALARDLGKEVGCGAHLATLRRTRSGAFDVSQAASVPQLCQQVEETGHLPVTTLAAAAANVMPLRKVSPTEAADLGYGKFLTPSCVNGPVGAVLEDKLVAILFDEGASAKPKIVLATS